MLTFIDARTLLPRNANKHFQTRPLSGLRGGVWHHTSGIGDVYDVARYHVGPNHVSPTGAPGILYTFFIQNTEKGAEIYWCHDLTMTPWSQGGNRVPLSGTLGNSHYLSTCFQGDFPSTGHAGRAQPSPQQLHAGLTLHLHLTGAARDARLPDALFRAVPYSTADLWDHAAFGKPACPGRALSALAGVVRSHQARLTAVTDWQRALVALGYDLGAFGPEEDGVDGEWGPSSRAALRAFQRKSSLEVTGRRNTRTERELVWRRDVKAWLAASGAVAPAHLDLLESSGVASALASLTVAGPDQPEPDFERLSPCQPPADRVRAGGARG